jgi:tricorn protease
MIKENQGRAQMSQPGYFRFPTIADDQVVFVSEDDLWTVPASGGVARRLTSGLGEAGSPVLSLDGKWLAFRGREEGDNDVYVMPSQGGQPQRLTFMGNSVAHVVGWTSDGDILFTSSAGQPFPRITMLYKVSRNGGAPEQLPTGPAVSASYSSTGGCVIGRSERDPARWKRYRGGTAGDLWIDALGDGGFQRLIQLNGNLTWPLWVGERIYFHSDHEGVGNLYSCTLDGEDLKRHTHHEDFYIRFPQTDGKRIVYHAGADIYLFDPASDQSSKIEIDYHSPRTQRSRKFVTPTKYLDSYALHPQGHQVAITGRGKAATMGHWEGAIAQYGNADAVRYRLMQWLHDGERMALVSDHDGEEIVEIYAQGQPEANKRLTGLDLGQIQALKASPTADQLAVRNQRNEIILVDLDTAQAYVLDHSDHGTIGGFNWSPDGKWIAYSYSDTAQTSIIKLANVEDKITHAVTKAVLADDAPIFDPDGKYLYFLSWREFDPVYDGLHFDLGFPKGGRPHLVTLQKETASPFFVEPKPDEASASKPDVNGEKEESESADPDKTITIDLDGIEDRILAFPVAEGRYAQLAAISGKVLWTTLPIEGSLGMDFRSNSPSAKATLTAFDFNTQKADTLASSITSFDLSQDGKTMIYRKGYRLRIQKAGEKVDDKTAGKPAGRESGWINLERIKLSVNPPSEWAQMMKEAWRLQRDNFWDAGMAEVDWTVVLNRYLPLLDRVGTRSEFSDLIWEMQGELGTSHAYEFGGDYRSEPSYSLGSLGADFAYNEETKVWIFNHIVRGDPWKPTQTSPLRRPGLNVNIGDTLLAVDGVAIPDGQVPSAQLVNRAGQEVALTVGDANGKSPRDFVVKTIYNDTAARYRDWVDANRAYVHDKTDGKVGYLHIPNMMGQGYAEFHRGFLAEIVRDGLLIDVRFNGGGHVSQLLLEKLSRNRIGFSRSRYSGHRPYPSESPAGPMVCLTNEFAGSDGDIFSHGFKLKKFGPLIGKRTWGGVVGINPNRRLADGSMTSQPQMAFWFPDVGWNVENYGTDPDIEVEMRPQDYVDHCDPQLDKAIEEVLKQFEINPPLHPNFEQVPSRALPKLPK